MRLLVLFFGGVDAGGGQGGAVPHATAGPPYRPSTPPRRGPPQRPGGPAGPPRPSPGRSVGTHCGGHGGIERRPSLGEAPEGTFQTRVQPLQKCNTDPQKSEAIKKTSKKQQQKNNRKITEKHKIRPILPMSQHIFKSKKRVCAPPPANTLVPNPCGASGSGRGRPSVWTTPTGRRGRPGPHDPVLSKEN